MKISILTLFPEAVQHYFNTSIMKRAVQKEKLEVEIVNYRDYANNKHNTVDDTPYGGGTGMVIQVDPVVRALRAVLPDSPSTATTSKVLLTSARGAPYTQHMAHTLSKHADHVVIICGHYEGFDERVHAYVDQEVSIGDFIMTGGEPAALAIADSIVRLVPGVLEKEGAIEEESFYSVPIGRLLKLIPGDALLTELHNANYTHVTLLEYPHYTRPQEFEGKTVPEILLSGHAQHIQEWRLKQAYFVTKRRRPELLANPKRQA